MTDARGAPRAEQPDAAGPSPSTPPRTRAARALAPALTALVLVVAGLFPTANPDTFGHLAAGRWIATHRAVPRLDPFSFWQPAPQPWFNYEWLSGLALWGAYALGGVAALLALKLALLALTGALLGLRAQASGAGERTAARWLPALCALAMPAARVRFSERPHLFALALLAGYLLALPALAARARERAAAPPRERLGALAPLALGLTLAHVAWVNLHGSHLLGLAVTAAHLAAFRAQRGARGALAALLGAQALATLASPYGLLIVRDTLEHVLRDDYRALVVEWAPLARAPHVVYPASAAVATALVAVRARATLRAGPAAHALLASAAALLLLALRAQRFLAEYLLVAATLLASGPEPARARRALDALARPRGAALAALALAALVAVGAHRTMHGADPFGAGLSRVGLPLGCGRFLAAQAPRARLLASFDDAWYAEFAAPDARVLLDGRVPFFGARFVGATIAAMQRPEGLDALTARYGLDALLVRHTEELGRRMVRAAALSADDWALVFVEDEHALYLRRTPEGAARVDALRLRALPAGYAASALLDPALDPAAATAELARIAHPTDGVGYRSWAAAMLSLRPLARGSDRAGLRPPRDRVERELALRAARRLRVAEREAASPPGVVPLWCALASAAGGDAQGAREALARARAASGDVRETVLAEVELALRAGRREEAVRTLALLPAAASGDPWVRALRDELR